MQKPITWQQWTQQLCNYIEAQKQRIDKLEQSVAKLQTELKELKDQKRVHIDKIEYHFDQLKVEKLDGTLTIGISPASMDAIDDFSVNGKSFGAGGGAGGKDSFPEEVPPDSGLEQQVSSGIEQYLKKDVQADMLGIEEKYQYPLEDGFRDMILDDIRKQIETRIRHYVSQYRSVGFDQPLEAVTANIFERTKQDILSAIETYISNLPRKDSD